MTRPNHNGVDVANKTVLITGANRGIGRALANEALRRGAKAVFAGTRSPLDIVDDRIKALTLDVTNISQIQRAVEAVDALDVLIFPDPVSQSIAEGWRSGAVKGLERQFALFAPERAASLQ